MLLYWPGAGGELQDSDRELVLLICTIWIFTFQQTKIVALTSTIIFYVFYGSFHSYHVPELLVWGKKKHTSPLPRYISAFSQTISWPTSWCVIDWLLPAGGGSWPDCSRTQTPSVFTSLRITNVKSVYYSFYPQGGWVGQFFLFSLNFASLFSCLYMSSLLDKLRARIGNIRFSSLLLCFRLKEEENIKVEILRKICNTIHRFFVCHLLIISSIFFLNP